MNEMQAYNMKSDYTEKTIHGCIKQLSVEQLMGSLQLSCILLHIWYIDDQRKCKQQWRNANGKHENSTILLMKFKFQNLEINRKHRNQCLGGVTS